MSTQTKTALITGSSSGIGLDIARAFLDRGSNVILNGRNADKLAAVAEELGQPERVAVVPGSISDRETGKAMVRAALERFDSVDVLVNNAGTFGAKPFVDVTEEDLDGYLNGNLKGTYLTTQAAVRQMKKEAGGAIVNIGTVLVDHAMAGLPSYVRRELEDFLSRGILTSCQSNEPLRHGQTAEPARRAFRVSSAPSLQVVVVAIPNIGNRRFPDAFAGKKLFRPASDLR